MEERTMEAVRQIPYGMMNFVAIREDNYYYVDKTRFIEKVEKANRRSSEGRSQARLDYAES